ncbi:MAG TPA: NosD domain-containing protein [Myxococcales bacterium]
MRALALCLAASLPAAAANLVVRPGQSIQAAVDRARPGDTVTVLPGTYTEAGRPCPHDGSELCAVSVTTDGISLIAPKGATLKSAAGQNDGIAFSPAGAQPATCVSTASQRLHGATVRGFTVRGFSDDGIFLLCADGIVVEGNTAVDNREYGIFPSHVVGGRVIGNHASGAKDTGIYVGQSRDVLVEGNVAQANVSGFEVENSSGVTVQRNLATGNTGGFLTFALPGLDVHANEANTLQDNVSAFNNLANECTGGDVCLVPAGTGILAVSTQRNVIRRNLVIGNDSLGIALTDFCSAAGVPPDVCATLDIEPLPNGNRIAENIVLRNGRNPDLARLPAELAGDLVWTGTGDGNCWSRNVAGTIAPLGIVLPSCP